MSCTLFSRISISKKIALLMSAIVLIILSLSIVAGYALSSAVSTFSALIDNESALQQHAHVAKIELLRIRRDEKDALYNDDESLVRSITGLAKQMSEKMVIMANLVTHTSDPVMIDTVKELTKNVEDYQSNFRNAVVAPAGQDRMRAAIPMRKAANEAEKNLDAFLEQVDKRIQSVKTNARQHVDLMKAVVITSGLAGAVFGIFFAVLLSRSIVYPLHKIKNRMVALAEGAFEDDVPFLTRGDEIGSMAKAVQVFKDNGIEAKKLRAAEQLKERAAEEARKSLFAQTEKFGGSISVIVKAISSASANMQSTATSMSATAEETTRESTSVAAAAEQASANVQTVASAAEELSSSVKEISRQVAHSSTVSQNAVEKSVHTDKRVQGLAEAAQQIGEVVKLINGIASQTNLLALNATIEAARAGEAGKGFAVVASEVKNLANQTAKATEEISAQISAVQASTKEAVSAIQDIGNTIRQSNEIASSIAASVEEQGTATKEIALNVQQAAAGTHEVSSSINSVSQAAAQTMSAANVVMGVANELSLQSENLRHEVDVFISDIRRTKA